MKVVMDAVLFKNYMMMLGSTFIHTGTRTLMPLKRKERKSLKCLKNTSTKTTFSDKKLMTLRIK